MDYQHIFEFDFGIQKIRYRGSQGQGLCPFHDDRNPSLSWSIENGLWTCFSGCGSGNTQQFAERLKLPNSTQYIEESIVDSKNGGTNGYRSKNNLKMENKQVLEVDKMVELEKLKNRYRNQVKKISDNIEKWKHKYLGLDDDGRTVFIYPEAIKHHKSTDGKMPWWEGQKDKNGKVIGSHCQIFMEDALDDYDKTKPLYIFEGEPDALISPLQGISFSSGATSIPDNLSSIYERGFPKIIIVYDNDKAGREGAKKLAKRIKKESPDTIVKIAQWDSSLPEGYDVYDDGKETGFARVDEAIANAIEYQILIPKKIGGFRFMTGEEMDSATPEPLEWYVEDIFPKRFNSIIAGTTGAKKSMFAMEMGMSLANAEKRFLGYKISSGYKVLYIDTEAGENEVTRRYQGIKKHMNWSGSHNWMMLSKNGSFYDVWDDLLEALKYYKPDIMIFDCLYNSTAVNEFSKSSQMTNVINKLGEFKSEKGIDTLAVHHFIKGKHDTFNIDRMSGSFVLQSWIEWCLLMIKTNREGLNMLRQGKSRGAREDNKIYGIHWDDYKFTMKGVINDIAPLMIDNHVKLKYVSILEDLPQRFDNKDWLNVFNTKFDLSEKTGYTWLKDATDSKLVKKITRGVYEKYLKIINEGNIDELM